MSWASEPSVFNTHNLVSDQDIHSCTQAPSNSKGPVPFYILRHVFSIPWGLKHFTHFPTFTLLLFPFLLYIAKLSSFLPPAGSYEPFWWLKWCLISNAITWTCLITEKILPVLQKGTWKDSPPTRLVWSETLYYFKAIRLGNMADASSIHLLLDETVFGKPH